MHNTYVLQKASNFILKMYPSLNFCMNIIKENDEMKILINYSIYQHHYRFINNNKLNKNLESLNMYHKNGFVKLQRSFVLGRISAV